MYPLVGAAAVAYVDRACWNEGVVNAMTGRKGWRCWGARHAMGRQCEALDGSGASEANASSHGAVPCAAALHGSQDSNGSFPTLYITQSNHECSMKANAGLSM